MMHALITACCPSEMNRSLPFTLSLLLLAGCQTLPEPVGGNAAPATTSSEPATVPGRNFERETLYDLLVAELAGQRQQPGIALQRYRRQLPQAQSPLVAERAFQIADYLDERNLARQSAQTWARLAPDSAEAHRAAAIELARSGDFNGALEHAGQAIALDPDSESHYDFIAFTSNHAYPDMRAALIVKFDQLMKQHPQRGELWLAQAILLQEYPEQAIRLLQQMPGEPGIPALALQARLYQQLDRPEQSLAIQQQLLELQPDNTAIRLNHARQLISLNRLEEARDQFLLLMQLEPDNDDFRLGLAYLYMDLEAWQEALVYLEELVQRDSYTDTALYNMGRCLEALEQPREAIRSYQSIGAGQYFLAARQQEGNLWLQLEQPGRFEALFADARKSVPDEQPALLQVEIETLSRNRQQEQAWQRATQALLQFPDDPNLLYTRAMLAEKRDDLQQLETDLRHILANDPEHAMAMNALGYTLADRTDRHAEALELIRRAHELQPDDAATLDSLGWVHYRSGQPELALPWLEQAYAAYPDPEVAAHLGEVLWALGHRRKARQVWHEALDKAPDHEILLETVQRLDSRKKWFKQ
ncbi:Flp pilus assembly protein TadD [Thiopseudomonas denitrificans]|uniref:Flp pilus assembly protein TadD n=2 Tax=Thiopseudomonas denitrificans TaxID=1501432 RepID=A0A4R6U3I3_9GAMM|nr:Flp pilus assembly protein TadD [Thiopseudomonas denitrificans]